MPSASRVVRPRSTCRTDTSVPEVRTTVRSSCDPLTRFSWELSATPDPRSTTRVSPATRTSLPSTAMTQQTASGGSVSVWRVSCNGATDRMRRSLLTGRTSPGFVGRCTAQAWDQIASASAIVARRLRLERDILDERAKLCSTIKLRSAHPRGTSDKQALVWRSGEVSASIGRSPGRARTRQWSQTAGLRRAANVRLDAE